MPAAIKVVDRRKLAKPDHMRLIKSEIHILQILDHPNIIKLYESQITADQVVLSLEMCEGGDLDHLIRRRKILQIREIQHIMRQLSSALSYMHTNSIVHRDVKPANLLIIRIDSLDIKLADFGFSRQINQDMAATYCGSPLYMAPEILTGAAYDVSVDIWGSGIIAYQCMAGAMPYSATSISQLRKIHKETKEDITYPADTDPALVDFIQVLLRVDPTQRIDSVKMMAHRFLRTDIQHRGAVPSYASSPSVILAKKPTIPKLHNQHNNLPDDSILGSLRALTTPREFTSSYVVVDRDCVEANQMADQINQAIPQTVQAATNLRERLVLLESLRDAMVFQRKVVSSSSSLPSPSPLSSPPPPILARSEPSDGRHFINEIMVAGRLFRLLKNTMAISKTGTIEDVSRFRHLFNECTDRIEYLRGRLLAQPPETAQLPNADDLLFRFATARAQAGNASSNRNDAIHGADCYLKSIAVFEYLKTKASTIVDATHLSQFIQSTHMQLRSLTEGCVRFCGMCGVMFVPAHNFCQSCGNRRQIVGSCSTSSSMLAIQSNILTTGDHNDGVNPEQGVCSQMAEGMDLGDGQMLPPRQGDPM